MTTTPSAPGRPGHPHTALRAERPRVSPPPETAFIHTCDSPEAIQRCLSCTRPQEDCFGTCTGPSRQYIRRPGSNRPGRPKRHKNAAQERGGSEPL